MLRRWLHHRLRQGTALWLLMAWALAVWLPCECRAMEPGRGERHIIIDTDMGADDASAILLAARSGKLQIDGITVLAGNVSLEQAAQNALMTLEVSQVAIPVYMGAEKGLSGDERELFSVYGKDGMGDAGLVHPKGSAQPQNAVDFILDTVRRNPYQTEIVLLGPATNIAMAIEKEPATMKKVKRFWSMGTAGFGEGNATPVAEFNVFKDPKAYKAMLELGVPVTVLGFDMVTPETFFTEQELAAMESGSETERFVAVSSRKLLEFRKTYLNIPDNILCDAVLMAAIVWPDFVEETAACHASCIADKGETFGQVIFYRKGYTYDTMPSFDSYHVDVVTKLNAKGFAGRYRKAI